MADAVERLREQGVAVRVVRPISAGDGRRRREAAARPWLARVFLGARCSRCGEPTASSSTRTGCSAGLVAALSGKPFVLTLHGSGSAGRFCDLELAERRPRLVARDPLAARGS